MTGFAVYGKMTAKPGQRDALIQELHEAVVALGEPAGLLHYTVNTVMGDPDTLWIAQTWTSKDAHDTATKTEANKARTAGLGKLLAAAEGAYGEVVDSYSS